MLMAQTDIITHLLDRIAEVRRNLGNDEIPSIPANAPFADLLDSMGMVELLGMLADDCGVSPPVIEECAERRFGTVAELSAAMIAAGLNIRFAAGLGAARESQRTAPRATAEQEESAAWLAGVTVRLPEQVQFASELDLLLHRPIGWMERHTGIRSRRLWMNEDPIHAAAECGRVCMDECRMLSHDVGALLVTSEAPPRLVGLAADVHHRLNLAPHVLTLEIGGACTGFLAALHLGRRLLPHTGAVLILAVEAPSRYLKAKPSPAGEAAALFGDAAAAVLLRSDSPTVAAIPVGDVKLTCHGESVDLIRVESTAGGMELRMDGPAVATRAVRAMTKHVRELVRENGLAMTDLEGVIVHGGNGRMPALIARQLGLPAERAVSSTADAGNLGSASLPAAWASLASQPRGPVVWTAAGAGLMSGAVLTGTPRKK
jgi:3-oxoacyl-[acyl-carrier-protein] synthase-3